MFKHFKEIDYDNKSTWERKRILTFDIDWASDEIILDTLDLLNQNNVKATFFVTHQTPVLGEIRSNSNFELAIHPNFNPILNLESEKSVNKVFEEILEIVPEAIVSRSHSLTNSGRWNSIYEEKGLRYTSNYFMYMQKDIKPIKNINDVVEIPIYFADDALLYLNDDKFDLTIPEFKTTNFERITLFFYQPIHVALNSNSLKLYDETRGFHDDFNKISNISKKHIGVRDVLKNLIEKE